MLIRLLILILILLCVEVVSFGQSFKVTLSEKHQKKLNAITSGRKRLLTYYKFYHKDSIAEVRRQRRFFKKSLDSAIERSGVNNFDDFSKANDFLKNRTDSISKNLVRLRRVVQDTTVSDSIKGVAKEQINQLLLLKLESMPNYGSAVEKYALTSDSASLRNLLGQIEGFDSLFSCLDLTPENLMSRAEGIAIEKFPSGEGFTDLISREPGDLKGIQDKYENVQKYASEDYWKSDAQLRATNAVSDFLAKHAELINNAQTKLSKLMGKYRSIPNSNDLSAATKRTSMKGTTFSERLVTGGNVNMISPSPFSIDLSPMVGYKFTANFHAGIGANYRVTFSDSIPNYSYISPKNSSLKAYLNYGVITNFFIHAEYERSSIRMVENDDNPKGLNNYFVGAGKKFLLHPKVYFTTVALYNLNGDDKNPVYYKRFQIKVGFQLTELATRKNRVSYDPNK